MRAEQLQLAQDLRADGQTWVEIAGQIRERWPELNARAAMRIAHGWTQQQAADAWNDLGLEPPRTFADISDMERRRPGLSALDKLARLYACSISDLLADTGDYRHLDEPRPLDCAFHPASAASGEPPVDRREFLASTVAGSVAAIGGQLAADVDAVERWTARRMALIDSDNLLGPHHAIVAASDQFAAIQAARENAVGVDRMRLLNVQIDYAEFLGWLYQDAGDEVRAQYWLDRALEWSHTSERPDTTVFILDRKSQLAGDMRRPDDAVDLAEAASRLAEPNSRMAAVAATFAGHGHALRGDDTACARWYDTAYEIELANSDSTGFYGFFDSAYIGAYQAHSLTARGEYESSSETFARALPGLQSGFYRDSGVYLARQAVAQAGAGDVDQASSNGLKALTIGVETRSGRIMNDLARLDDLLHQRQRSTDFQDAWQAKGHQ